MNDPTFGVAQVVGRLLRLAGEVALWTIVPIIIVIALAGIGAWAVRSAQAEVALVTAAVSGALVVIAGVTLLNLFVAIPRGPGLLIVPVGLIALMLSARRLGIDRAVLLRLTPWALFATAIYRFGRRSLAYDAFLYHGGILEWVAREPTPSGLGLLHSRFAFNPGLALLMAPFRSTGTDWNHHVLVEIAVVVIAFLVLAAMLHRASGTGEASVFGLIAAVTTLATIFLMFRNVRVGMDLAPGLTILAAFAVAATLSRQAFWSDRERTSAFALLGVLVAFAVVQKTSTALGVLLLLVPLFAGSRSEWRQPFRSIEIRQLIPVLLLSVAAGVLMAARTWVMSGCLVYPVALTCRDGGGAVGREQAAAESAVILSWARSGSMDHLSTRDFSWVERWYSDLEWDIAFRLTVFAVLVGLVVRGIGWLVAGRRPARLPGLLWAYAFLSLAFWFVAAPDSRFGFSSFLALGALVLAPAFMVEPPGTSARRSAGRVRVGPLVSVTAVLAVTFASVLAGGRYFPFSGEVAHPMQSDVLLSPTGLAGDEGWRYLFPVGSDQCGDAFPCAPGPRDLTVERVGGRLVFRGPVS